MWLWPHKGERIPIRDGVRVGGEAILIVLDGAAVGGIDLLQDGAILVKAGDLDADALHLLLDIYTGSEHDATSGDKAGLHVVQLFYFNHFLLNGSVQFRTHHKFLHSRVLADFTLGVVQLL